MTHITLPRATVEQALEAMRCAVPTGKITLADWHKSIGGLEAVLAQQVKHVAWMHPWPPVRALQWGAAPVRIDFGSNPNGWREAFLPLGKDNTLRLLAETEALPLVENALRAALAQQAEPVEPAYKVKITGKWHEAEPLAAAFNLPDGEHLLYTAPPQRKPLTDEEIDKATAQERDALLDHIYEYGTAAEGVLERIRKLCRAVERKVRGEEK